MWQSLQASWPMVSQFAASRSSIPNRRKFNRSKIARVIKENFIVQKPICVHWDGKLIQDMTDDKKMVDRLPVIVLGNYGDKLLGVPKKKSGTGINQARAVFKQLQE